jgi:hypothetical protein
MKRESDRTNVKPPPHGKATLQHHGLPRESDKGESNDHQDLQEKMRNRKMGMENPSVDPSQTLQAPAPLDGPSRPDFKDRGMAGDRSFRFLLFLSDTMARSKEALEFPQKSTMSQPPISTHMHPLSPSSSVPSYPRMAAELY